MGRSECSEFSVCSSFKILLTDNSPRRLHQKGTGSASVATDDHSRPICLDFRSLFSPFSKLLKVADVTVLSSRAFQMLIIRSVKKYSLKSVLNLFLHNLLECPRVLPSVSYSKKVSKCIPEVPLLGKPSLHSPNCCLLKCTAYR